MKKLTIFFLSLCFMLVGMTILHLASPDPVYAQANAPTCTQDGTIAPHSNPDNCFKCEENGFLGLISWHHYLPKKGDCSVDLQLVGKDSNGNDVAQTSKLNSLWLIAIAIFEDLLRIAGVVAVAFIVFGGISYITGDGQPENIKRAHAVLINALIGLAITVIGASLVAFIGNRLGGS